MASKSSASSHTTIDHEKIRRWAEERGGHPTSVEGTGDGEVGVLRLDFEINGQYERLEEISWEDFFAKFDEKNLAFLYQDETSGGEQSRFFKLVNRDTVRLDDQETDQVTEPEAAPQESEEISATSEPLMDKEMVRCLNDIIKADIRVVEAYQEAISQSQNQEVANLLREYCDSHEQQLLELENLVYGFGGEPKPLLAGMDQINRERPISQTTHH